MAVSEVQGKLVPFKISSDAGTTWKTLVCLRSANLSGSTNVTEEETQCGVIVGVGANAWEFSTDAVANLTPTTASELSYKDILGIWSAQTKIMVKQEYPEGGTNFHTSGYAYITSLSNQVQVGSAMSFSCTFKGTGDLDIAA